MEDIEQVIKLELDRVKLDLLNIKLYLHQLWLDISYILEVGTTKRWDQITKAKKILALFGSNTLDKIANGVYKPGHSRIINATEELPLARLVENKNKYQIFWEPIALSRGVKLLLPKTKCIDLKDEPIPPRSGQYPLSFSQVGTSLHEYYEKHVSDFSLSILRSNDLLDQLFCVYMIKLAQDGDPESEARKQLIKVLKPRAYLTAQTWYWYYEKRYPDNNLGITQAEVIAYTYELIAKFCFGDAPNEIGYLLDKEAKKILPIRNRRTAKLIIESAKAAVNQADLYYAKAKNLLNEMYQSPFDDFKGNFDIILTCIQAIYTLIRYPMSWLYPNDYENAFNRQIYRPYKGGNLESYLFGAKSTSSPGAIYRGLNDWLKRKLPELKKFTDKLDFNDHNRALIDLNSSAKYEPSGEELVEDWIEATRPPKLYATVVRYKIIYDNTYKEIEDLINGKLGRRQMQRIVGLYRKWIKNN